MRKGCRAQIRRKVVDDAVIASTYWEKGTGREDLTVKETHPPSFGSKRYIIAPKARQRREFYSEN
jgi:hypothetical protein